MEDFELPTIKCPKLLLLVDRKTCMNCEYHLKQGKKHYCRFVDVFSDYIKLWEDY